MGRGGGGGEENGTFVPFVPRKTRNRKRTYRIENGLDAIPFRTAFLSPPHGPPRSEKRSIGFIYIYIFFSSRPFFFFLLSFLAIRLYNRYSYLGHERQPPPSLLFPLPSVSPRFVKHLFGTIKTRRPRSNGAGRTTSMYDTRIETYRQLYAHPPATPTLIPSI